MSHPIDNLSHNEPEATDGVNEIITPVRLRLAVYPNGKQTIQALYADTHNDDRLEWLNIPRVQVNELGMDGDAAKGYDPI